LKHHIEKKSYYFDLIDHLAKLKINGIIVELEDKLKYESESSEPSSMSIISYLIFISFCTKKIQFYLVLGFFK
jgi:hypothetical protein